MDDGRRHLPVVPAEGIDGGKKDSLRYHHGVPAGSKEPGSVDILCFRYRPLPEQVPVAVVEKSPAVACHGGKILPIFRKGGPISHGHGLEMVGCGYGLCMDQSPISVIEHIYIFIILQFFYFCFIIIGSSKGKPMGSLGIVAPVYPGIHISIFRIFPADVAACGK